MSESLPRTRVLTVVAQDPSVKTSTEQIPGRSILTEQIEIPAEDFSPGPYGFRVHVVDYDSSTGTHYKPMEYPEIEDGSYPDPFEKITDEEILNSPRFHAQNVYAIVMKTLARFEFALGRRISWGFLGHQIYVAPHAFADANAFYSEQDRALMFGYFSSPGTNPGEQPNRIFSCLSHDVVAHEATHAILDGLREGYTTPTSPEQAGFHEGFADVVALLSMFGLPRVIGRLLELIAIDEEKDEMEQKNPDLIHTDKLTEEKLKNSPIFGLGDQMGEEMFGVRGKALRRSVTLATLAEGETYLGKKEFNEPHRCGELFVAAIMSAFLQIWLKRIDRLKAGKVEKEYLDRSLVVDNGAGAANTLLTMVIRAIDYTPPTDITFSDYLTALLTADKETVPNDSKYHYRDILKKSFKMYGVKPVKDYWDAPTGDFKYDRIHFDSLLRDPDEVFRFIWDNRNELESIRGKRLFDEKAYTRVQSVRPCLKIGPDGFAIRETVAEYVQIVNMMASELEQYNNIDKPQGMPVSTEVTLYGGGTLIFDEYGKLKYHINNCVFSQKRQTNKIKYLWDCGFYSDPEFTKNAFSKMHLRREAVFSNHSTEEGFD